MGAMASACSLFYTFGPSVSWLEVCRAVMRQDSHAPEDHVECRDSSVGRMTRLRLNDQRSTTGSGSFSPLCHDWLCQSNGYWGLFPRRWSGRGVKVTTHLHLVPRLRMQGAIPPPLHHMFARRAEVRTQTTIPYIFIYTTVYPKVSGLSHNEIYAYNNKHLFRSNTKGYS
jgi:hypothetical protein